MSPPFYEYLCDKGHEFMEEQPITDDSLAWCTFKVTVNAKEMEGKEGYGKPILMRVCNAPCRRQRSKSSFVLKGGGWSGDGYAKKGN